MRTIQHHYVERETGAISPERLFGDAVVNYIYSEARENAPTLFRALTSSWSSRLLGYINYDFPLSGRLSGVRRFAESCGIDLAECLDDPATLTTARKVFERKIRYWNARPMIDDPDAVVSPADARALAGSFRETSKLFIKNKFFEFEEMIGVNKPEWQKVFAGGDFAIFRLTPDKYHYNHTPVAGEVMDIYHVDGNYHSCNPAAVVAVATPYSKNKRVVTVIDTDVRGGTGVGIVAMIEVVALMIGDIQQCYSAEKYDSPMNVKPGMFLAKGAPKSLYRPGSSTDILIFQKNRITFEEDIVLNMRRNGAPSRFSLGFGQSLMETDVRVRSVIARKQS